MGGTAEFVFWQGQRLTLWMLYVLRILDAQLWAKWRVRLVLVSAIRTYEEQTRIFLMRYVRSWDVNGRTVYDTRWWNGALWYRIDKTGTVAQPGTSNHEIRGDVAAVDIKDTGSDPGITAKSSERGRWLRLVFGPQYGMDPEGDSFAEGWHHRMRGIFRTPPTSGGATTTKEKIKVKRYTAEDGKARRVKGVAGATVTGLDLVPGAASWLHTSPTVSASKASNIVGGVGEYAFYVHVYADGEPGDTVDVVLGWDDIATPGPHSMHFVERIVIGPDGTARRNVSFSRPVMSGAKGTAVYAKIEAGSKNEKAVKVTRFATDAILSIPA